MFLQEVLLVAANLVVGLGHMHRNTNRIAKVSHSTRHRLANPPGRVGRELIATTVFKLVHRLHEPEVPFLNQVRHRETTIHITLGNGDHQTQIGFNHASLGLHQVRLSKL